MSKDNEDDFGECEDPNECNKSSIKGFKVRNKGRLRIQNSDNNLVFNRQDSMKNTNQTGAIYSNDKILECDPKDPSCLLTSDCIRNIFSIKEFTKDLISDEETKDSFIISVKIDFSNLLKFFNDRLNFFKKSISIDGVGCLFRRIQDIAKDYLCDTNIDINDLNIKQVTRFLQLFILIFLMSRNYKELINNTVDFTGLSKSYSGSLVRDTLNLLESHGVNVSKWRPKVIYGIEIYSEQDVKRWKELYETLGSYNSVKDHLRKTEGEGPSDTTIKERLKQYFSKNKLDFKKWEKIYKRNIKLQKYGEKEELYWMRLYEEFGSFYQVSLHLQKAYGKILRSPSIKNRIKKRFLREKRSDFEEWIKKHKKDNPTQFQPIYTDQDVEVWQKLFEKFGFISKVIEEFGRLKRKKYETIPFHYRLSKKFEEEGKDFEIWYKNYRKSVEHFEKKYIEEDIEEWERLFEEIGSFSGVSYYLSEILLSEDLPHASTIKNYLREKFSRESRDFEKWIIKFFSPNHKRANNIGFYIHYIMEHLFIRCQLRKGNNRVYYEISPSVEKDTVIDNAIIDLEHYPKMTCIDYSTSRYKTNLFEKLFKNYQSMERELRIISLLIDDKVKIPRNIRKEYKENVIVMNKVSFAKWAGYDKDELKLYNRTIDLAKSALYNDEDYDILKEWGKRAQMKLHELSKIHPIKQEDLMKYLKFGAGKDYSYILRDIEFRSLKDFLES